MEQDQYFKRIFSLSHCLSTDIPSNSRFLAIRQLEYQIKKQILPLLILLSKDKKRNVSQSFRRIASNYKSDNSPFLWIYRFGYDLNEGLLHDAENLSLDEFKRIHNSLLNKAFSFDSVMQNLSAIIDSFVDKVEAMIKEQIDAFSRNLSSGLVSLSNAAFQQGLVASMTKGRSMEDVYITKVVYPGACKHCIRIYLNPDGSPKIFKLSELEANGFDLSRKPADYKPVLLGLHFNCRCTNLEVPVNISKEDLEAVYATAIADYTEARKQLLDLEEHVYDNWNY